MKAFSNCNLFRIKVWISAGIKLIKTRCTSSLSGDEIRFFALNIDTMYNVVVMLNIAMNNPKISKL